jgi:hypothetical protein
MLQSAAKEAPSVIPRHHIHGASVDLVKPVFNLSPPGFMHVIIDLGVETFQQRFDKGRARFRREGQRVFQQFRRLDFHTSVVLPARGRSDTYSRLIRLATYPAPKPLSIFTTVTLLAQLFNIPSNAARPLKLAP